MVNGLLYCKLVSISAFLLSIACIIVLPSSGLNCLYVCLLCALLLLFIVPVLLSVQLVVFVSNVHVFYHVINHKGN